MTGSNDTQEEKSQPDGTIPPSCLNLTVHRKEQGHKRDKHLKDNVMLYCTKVPKVEDAEEEPTCPRYSCMSGPIQRNCSTINFIQTYNTVQCHKEGQKPRKRHKCWAKGDKNHGNIDLCCLPEVLENVTLKEAEEEPRCPSPTMLPLPPAPGSLDSPGGHRPVPGGPLRSPHPPWATTRPLGPPRATNPWGHQGPPRPGDHPGSPTPGGPPRPGAIKGNQPLGTTKGHQDLRATLGYHETPGDQQDLGITKGHQTSPGPLRSSS